MFRVTSWAGIALLCVGVADGREPPKLETFPVRPTVIPPPPSKEKPSDEAWFPKFGTDPYAQKNKVEDVTPIPPSAFPDIVLPVLDEDAKDAAESIKKYEAAFDKMCPRLFGTTNQKIEVADGTLQKLLKARLHQGTLEFQDFQIYRRRGKIQGVAASIDRYRGCLLDMQSAAVELWSKQPKELAPWLEELLLAAKAHERFTQIRVVIGSAAPSDLTSASRTRLKIEAELWKAKNPK